MSRDQIFPSWERSSLRIVPHALGDDDFACLALWKQLGLVEAAQ